MANLADYMREQLDRYRELVDLERKDFPCPFWDLVVIGATDAIQGEAYEQLLQSKIKCKQFPRDVPYTIIIDPPGYKAGCGGAMMNIIYELDRKFGVELESMRVLLLSAGGYSQRMPNSTVLGKIFMSLPTQNQACQLIDLKMACFLPFLERMRPGIFHAAGDTIEVFALDRPGDWNFEQPGMTVLAHPSTLDIGMTHGVFVMHNAAETKNSNTTKDGHKNTTNSEKCEGDHKNGDVAKSDLENSSITSMSTCWKVLQKPSMEEMIESGAIVEHFLFPGGTSSESEKMDKIVYTDSNFFVDYPTAGKLLKLYKTEMPLNCEVDGYGDFMQAMGEGATRDYIRKQGNAIVQESRLSDIREKLFDIFRNVPLNVLMLNASKFYHVGTTKECLMHFCDSSELEKELEFGSIVESIFTDEKGEKVSTPSKHIKGCVVKSLIPNKSQIHPRSILEYCDFQVPVEVGKDCMISNCEITQEKGGKIPKKTSENTRRSIHVHCRSSPRKKDRFRHVCFWYVRQHQAVSFHR